jgi:acyl-CoA thioesterase-1
MAEFCTLASRSAPLRGARSYGRFRAAFQAVLRLAVLALAFAAPTARAQEQLRVLAFGDSLTVGFELPADGAFPAQLERRLRADGFSVEVVNAGVSGDTTAAGLARIDFALADKSDLVILELGANDALRGVDPKQTRANLEKMLDAIAAKRTPTILAGMVASANFGQERKAEFDAIFPDLAKQRGLALYPFFLAGLGNDPSLVQRDGLHPTVDGVGRIVAGIAPIVEDSLRSILTGRAKATQ